MASSSPSTMIQEARIAEPPTQGAKLNTALTLPLAGQLAASDEQAIACTLNQLTLGRLDQGPVQAATTIRSTANGIQACATSAGLSASPCACRRTAGSTGTPP